MCTYRWVLGLPYSKYVKCVDSTTFFVNHLLKFIAVSWHLNVDVFLFIWFSLPFCNFKSYCTLWCSSWEIISNIVRYQCVHLCRNKLPLHHILHCFCSLSSESQNLISDMCGYCWHYLTGHILALLQQYQVYVCFLYYYVIYSEMFCIQHVLMFAMWLKWTLDGESGFQECRQTSE